MRVYIRWLQNMKLKRSNILNYIITLLLATLIVSILVQFVNWFFLEANWNVISQNFPIFFLGLYPKDQYWRPLIWIILIILSLVLRIKKRSNKRVQKISIFLSVLIIPLGIFLLGGGLGLTSIPSREWGGLILTLLLTLCSGVLALPLGIILALGRHSNLYFINRISRLYIEFMRALPLIAVLFFGQLLIPLFLPIGLEINRFLRAVIAFSFFTSAYIAEDVRGGLQSIPPTQIESASALGLSQRQIIQFVLLPQALRTAIPSLTNQAVGLFQNTSLMAILGLMELLGISRSILANPNFIGNYLEVYVFIAIIYWLIGTVIALFARNIEHQLNSFK